MVFLIVAMPLVGIVSFQITGSLDVMENEGSQLAEDVTSAVGSSFSLISVLIIVVAAALIIGSLMRCIGAYG